MEYMAFDKAAIFKSGLFAELGVVNFHTLTGLVCFMDENGVTEITQSELADILGVRRETLLRRIKALCDFRWNGHYIIEKERWREGGRFSSNTYRLNPEFLLFIKTGKQPYRIYEYPELSEAERVERRMIKGYSEWVAAVKERDNMECLKCGSSHDLHAHHIEGYTEHPEGRIDVNNGATLCGTCHREFHIRYGRSGFSREDFNEYMRGDSLERRSS